MLPVDAVANIFDLDSDSVSGLMDQDFYKEDLKDHQLQSDTNGWL